MNKRCLLLTLMLLAPLSPQADEVQPIIYNRVTLKLIPKVEPKIISSPNPLPAPKPVESAKKEGNKDKKKNELATKDDEKKPEELKVDKSAQTEEDPSTPAPPSPRTPIDFTVEVKTQQFLDQTDFISHSSFGEHEGLLISIEPAAVSNLTATQMVGMSDVIFINEDGVITKIAPSLNLAELNEPISSGSPVRAFLYIKPGSVEQDRIVPGDRFESSMFKTHPIILQ